MVRLLHQAGSYSLNVPPTSLQQSIRNKVSHITQFREQNSVLFIEHPVHFREHSILFIEHPVLFIEHPVHFREHSILFIEHPVLFIEHPVHFREHPVHFRNQPFYKRVAVPNKASLFKNQQSFSSRLPMRLPDPRQRSRCLR